MEESDSLDERIASELMITETMSIGIKLLSSSLSYYVFLRLSLLLLLQSNYVN